MKTARILLLAFALASCADEAPIRAENVHVELSLGPSQVEFGEPFPLTVTRVWKKGWAAEPWDDTALAPLTLELEETRRREDQRYVEERLVFRARAFAQDPVIGPLYFYAGPPPLEGPGALPPMPAEPVPPFVLTVRPLVDPDDPGEPELPGGLLEEGFPWRSTLAGAVALLVALVLLLRRTARPVAEPETAPVPPPVAIDHAAIALERFEALAGRQPGSPAEVVAFYVACAEAIRDYVAGRSGTEIEYETSEDIVGRPEVRAAFSERPLGALAQLLRTSDHVKFGGLRPGQRERRVWLADAKTLVEETAS